MTETEVRQVLETLTSYWSVSNARAKGIVQWLRDRHITVGEATAALSALVEQYDEPPSIKQLGVKLAELGTDVKPRVGDGNPVVIERMKARILECARWATDRTGQPLNDRLREEQAATREYHDEAVRGAFDEESVGYYRDQLAAYAELLGGKTG